MAKISKFFVFMIGFVILLNAAYAASFEVKVTPVKDKIVVNEIAEFNISIQNNLDTGEEFMIKQAGYPFWDMYTKPLQNPITIRVPSQSSASLKLFVNPLYITSVDTYTLEIGVVRESANEEQKVPITIGIKSTEPLISGYIPTVVASVSISPKKIDPRQEAEIKVVLGNQNVINYTNLTLKIESSLFSENIYFPLGPKEDKTIEVPFKLDSMTAPQTGKLVVAISKDDRVIVSPIENEFEVIQYTVTQDLQKQQSFLKIRKAIKVMSNNPSNKEPIKVETTPLKNLFSTTSPRANSVKESGKYYLVWDVSLGPDNTMTVYITENYRPIVVVILIAIAAVVFYFLFRSPIVVRKSIANIGMSEGGISEAKVVVRVKNRSANQITSIEVIDHVPHIAHVEKELSIGSMQPHAIMQHPKRGVIIKWNLEALEAGDERVLSYKMKSRLAILGEFNLPAATARCKIGNKVVISNSNRVSVGG